jgi:hypothetical protein
MRALIDELDDISKCGDSPDQGSSARTLVDAVCAGTRSALEAWLLESSSQWDAIRPYITVAVQAAAVDPELREVVGAWFDQAIADIRTGLDEADCFDPATRHARSTLASPSSTTRPDTGSRAAGTPTGTWSSRCSPRAGPAC